MTVQQAINRELRIAKLALKSSRKAEWTEKEPA